MKNLIAFLAIAVMALPCRAQVTVSGYVRSILSREPVADAEVRVRESGVSVITNEDGYFSMKFAEMPSGLVVSALGFRNKVVERKDVNQETGQIEVFLVPETRMLNSATVYAPEYIVQTAIKKIADNYSADSERLSCFYRETVRKQNRYVNLSEVVMDLYKTDYGRGIDRDQVQVLKGRNMISQRLRDTLAVQVAGGPNEAVVIDLVKNREMLLYEDDIPAYSFSFGESTSIDERQQYVIHFKPRSSRQYALYSGTLYIDAELLAFTRMEVSLEMDSALKATEVMLHRKPLGLRFKPRELTTIVSYHFDGQRFRLSYMRNSYHFNCDWKKKLFSTSYRVVSEMVVTDYVKSDIPRNRRNAFRPNDILNTRSAGFNDPAFWESYNILEPSESLEHAIGRLKKRSRQ